MGRNAAFGNGACDHLRHLHKGQEKAEDARADHGEEDHQRGGGSRAEAFGKRSAQTPARGLREDQHEQGGERTDGTDFGWRDEAEVNSAQHDHEQDEHLSGLRR